MAQAAQKKTIKKKKREGFKYFKTIFFFFFLCPAVAPHTKLLKKLYKRLLTLP